MRGFQKIANRITAGIVIAALIIGAALIMKIETSWTILGYPALAGIFFLIAAIAGTVLVVQAMWNDD